MGAVVEEPPPFFFGAFLNSDAALQQAHRASVCRLDPPLHRLSRRSAIRRRWGLPRSACICRWLAESRHVSASTQNQALSALRFLYRDVLQIDVGRITGLVAAKVPHRLPIVLTRVEVLRLLQSLKDPFWLIAALLYGAGLRLNECLELRVKDLDFERSQITVRRGKGGRTG